MTTVHVRRTTIVLSLCFLSAAGLYGLLGRRAGGPSETGAVAFAARCGACHDAAAVAASARAASDRAAKLAAIDALLASGHGDASEDEARAIVAYLKDLASR